MRDEEQSKAPWRTSLRCLSFIPHPSSLIPSAESLIPISSQPLPVLLLVVIAVVARSNLVDPLEVRAVPVDRLSQTLFESHLRRPAQFRLGFRAVDGVAPVVTRSVLDVADQRARLTE